MENGETHNRVTRTCGSIRLRLMVLIVPSLNKGLALYPQVAWSTWELWERVCVVSLTKNDWECSRALWEPIRTRIRTFLCQASFWWLGPAESPKWEEQHQTPLSEMSQIMVRLVLQMTSKNNVFWSSFSKYSLLWGWAEGRQLFKNTEDFFSSGLSESLVRARRESPVCWCWGPSQTLFIIHA